jgi:hypothetical protein
MIMTFDTPRCGRRDGISPEMRLNMVGHGRDK